MRDGYGRDIYYLRLSVTDLCNLRCVYCMPAQGVEKRRHEDILSIEELEEIALAAGRCGIRKIRLTGGEPLVRRGIVDICARTAAAPGVEEVCMTTNGLLLPGLAADLRRAGLRRVNISLDTLSPERYRQVTRIGELEAALAGLRAALDNFETVKINAVLIGGEGEAEIPRMVEPNLAAPSRSSSQRSCQRWNGIQIMARSLIRRFAGEIETPASCARLISPHRCSRSITTPTPSRFSVCGRKMPEGKRLSLNVPRSLTTVCPALFPP